MTKEDPSTVIDVVVNGEAVRDEVANRQLLVEYLREIRGLLGTKVGCDSSACGACTVLLDGLAVKACTILAVQVDGTAVTTVEGLAASSAMHAVQSAFQRRHAVQCGFCTSGFLMAAVALISRSRPLTQAEVRKELKGNLCRCTGYQAIVEAVMDAAAELHAT